MAAGMKDVASLAGVAVGTVSNVLNHPDLVRPLTRARVEAAMETVFWYRRAGEPGHVHTDRILGIKHARLITKARG